MLAQTLKAQCAVLDVSPTGSTTSGLHLPMLNSTLSAHPSPCLGESNPGTGSENVSRWFYDVRTYKCLPFTYTGVGGNQNNFVSKEDCLKACPGNRRCSYWPSCRAQIFHFSEIRNPCPLGEPVMEPGPGGFVLPLSCNPNSAQGICPPNNWCHVGESEETTMCCPRTSGACFVQLPITFPVLPPFILELVYLPF